MFLLGYEVCQLRGASLQASRVAISLVLQRTVHVADMGNTTDG